MFILMIVMWYADEGSPPRFCGPGFLVLRILGVKTGFYDPGFLVPWILRCQDWPHSARRRGPYQEFQKLKQHPRPLAQVIGGTADVCTCARVSRARKL